MRMVARILVRGVGIPVAAMACVLGAAFLTGLLARWVVGAFLAGWAR